MPLVLIPGTATDWRMYTPQLEQFDGIIVPEWIEPLSEDEPLTSYTQRWAACLPLPDRYALGGVSLGGMIAQELAHHLSPACVLLIATSTHYRDIPWLMRMQGHCVERMPRSVLRALAWLVSKIVPPFLTSNAAHRATYAAMVREFPPHLIAWHVHPAIRWRRTKPIGVPVHRIHGRKDWIIAYPNDDAATQAVPYSGHFISVTRAERVNHFIRNALQQTQMLHQAYQRVTKL